MLSPPRTALLTILIALAVAALAGTAAAHPRRGHAASRRPAVHRLCVARSQHSTRRNAKGHSRGRAAAAVKCTGHAPLRARKHVGPVEATPVGGGSAPTPETGSGSESKSKHFVPLPQDDGETVTDPIDSRFLTDDPFGSTSFWIQPWRAYLDTWPSSTLTSALGINFNVSPAQAEPTAQLLQESGFKLARVPIDWSALSYEDPTTFNPLRLSSIVARLTALHKHGLRPLIVLDAYAGNPTPSKHVALETTAAVPAGAQTVKLTPASAAQVVPGKTGFNNLAFNGDPDVLITSVNSEDIATLSMPLKAALPAGKHGGTTLLYAPFGAPTLAGGEANPVFHETMAGWLNYVSMVTKEAASIVGPGGFDLEVWNELTFGSQFLNAEHYYGAGNESQARELTGMHDMLTQQGSGSEGAGEEGAEVEGSYSSREEDEYDSEAAQPLETEEAPEQEAEAFETESAESQAAIKTDASKVRKRQVNKEIRKLLLDETVAFVRNPSNGISPEVGITDGFASETPFPSGASAPLGLTALSKHPYVSGRLFPAANKVQEGIVPLNSLGARDTLRGSFAPLFVPAYQSLLPEYTLTASSTETLIRDVAPMTTDIYHFPHGRYVGPRGGVPLQKWITEYNLGTGHQTVEDPNGYTPATGESATLTEADKAHFEAKTILRSFVSMIGKGISREYFFAAAPGGLSLIGNRFFEDLEAHPGTYPGTSAGGETLTGLRNTLSKFQGPGPEGPARQLTLLSIRQDGNHAQFVGDGTEEHPTLYDRDVLAVLPFQTSPTRFVIPVYVMSRDLLTLYKPEQPDSEIHRFDLPQETFWITLGNLPESSSAPAVSAYDPLTGSSTTARLVSRTGSTGVFEVSATDYPRLLTIEYPGS